MANTPMPVPGLVVTIECLQREVEGWSAKHAALTIQVNKSEARLKDLDKQVVELEQTLSDLLDSLSIAAESRGVILAVVPDPAP